MSVSQIGPAALELIEHRAGGVGDNLDVGRFIVCAGFHFLAIDHHFLGKDLRQDAGIVHDADDSIARYLGEGLTRVQVLIGLGHLDGEVITLVLAEDGMTIDVAVAFVRIGHRP